MTTIGLQIGVLVTLRVEVGAQIVVVLDQEVGVTATDPEELGILTEQVVDLAVAVSIDVGEAVGIGLLLIDSGREQAYVAKQIRIINADEETVETTHRQASDSTMSLILLHTISLLDEVHHIGESSLKRTLHGLGQHHRGHLEAFRGLTRASLLRDVTIGHHHQHRLCLTLGNEVIQDLGSTTQFTPCILVATNTM